MKIKKLALINFRNYESFFMEPEDGINVIYGNNGTGKTNILEAVYWMSFNKSFRTSEDQALIKHENNFCSVKMDCDLSGMEKTFEISYDKTTRKKIIKINENRLKKHSEIIGKIPTVLFSPENIMIIKGDPVLRRKQIDELVSQIYPGYYDLLIRYSKEVSHRNYLLKGIKEGRFKKESIEVWNDLITEKGTEIVCKRQETLISLNEILNDELNYSDAKIKLTYESKNYKSTDIDSIKESYKKHFIENFNEELARGSTTIGPHKDDIKIEYDGRSAKLFASEGQQRITAIMIKLAEGLFLKKRINIYPVILLDDFSSELDEFNRDIIGKTFSVFRQILVTTTSLENLKGLSPKKTFHVEHLIS